MERHPTYQYPIENISKREQNQGAIQQSWRSLKHRDEELFVIISAWKEPSCLDQNMLSRAPSVIGRLNLFIRIHWKKWENENKENGLRGKYEYRINFLQGLLQARPIRSSFSKNNILPVLNCVVHLAVANPLSKALGVQ